MEKLTIKKESDPILRQKAKKVTNPLDKGIQELILNMTESMHENNGVGLAAPQVGLSIRLCIVETEGIRYVMINPKITSKSRKKVTAEEGCLSCPGKFYQIARAEEVQVRYTDEYGNPAKAKGRGLLARAFQHEIDHLDGILIVDKVKKGAFSISNNKEAVQKNNSMEKDAKEIKIRTVFMGTSDLSEIILGKLIENKYNLVGVFTKPDTKIGREQEISMPPVKTLAEKNKIPVFQPQKFNEEAIEQLNKLNPDIVIVAAYGKIIPKKALEIPGFGCINVHVSLLPKYRGPSPIQNALLQGEKETGVTIMLMDEKVDTGDILAQEKYPIDPSDNTKTLMEKLSHFGSDLLLNTVPLWVKRKIQPKPQDHSLATLCQLIEREDGHIYWSDTAESIYNRFRALTPWPGIFSNWENANEIVRLKLISIGIQKIDPVEKRKKGEVFELGDDVGVQTSEGVIIIKEIQREGKNPVKAKDFTNGYPNFIGSILK